MSPTMAMTMPPAMYAPSSDAMDRHEYGITKHHRKNSSTGGGRAWSEDEEVYLLQTRLQKMPYKHIAAHLKKTELACRLHYHQLSHGSNRRKRTTSMSSSSSSATHSPIMHATIPSPIHESPSRSVSPPGSLLGYGNPGSPGGVQLPSILSSGVVSTSSPRLPAILPKPANMSMSMGGSRYSSPLQQEQQPPQHSTPLLPSATFQQQHAPAPSMAPLRLDCSSAPPASSSQPVDMGRLHAVYSAHRNSFWSTIAAEYGPGMHPSVLEQAWKQQNSSSSSNNNSSSSNSNSNSNNNSSSSSSSSNTIHGYAAPITPVGSPDERDIYNTKQQDRTRISAILGIDANPRSPKERELVRRMEEERVMVGVGA